MTVKPVPAGYHTATPYLVVDDGRKAIDFYKRAFNAELHMSMEGPGGMIIHAEVRIGDSIVMLGEEMPNMYNKSPKSVGSTTAGVMLYVPDVDKAFQQAVAAGATVSMPLADMFWGDRYGQVKDPCGHNWSLATHMEDVSPAEMKKRQDAFFAQMAQQEQS